MKAAQDERKARLRERELDEERRLFYVALTHAQRALFVSRALWYGTNMKSRGPSIFWDKLVATGLLESLGEEGDPGFNPRLMGGDRTSVRGEEKGEGLARILLAPDCGAGWVEKVASEHPEGWERRKREVDARLSLLASPLGSGSGSPSVKVSCSGLIDGHDEALRHSREELVETESWVERIIQSIQSGDFPCIETARGCADCCYAHLCIG